MILKTRQWPNFKIIAVPVNFEYYRGISDAALMSGMEIAKIIKLVLANFCVYPVAVTSPVTR